MKVKPKKKMVEHALDTLVIEILLEPSEKRLNHFRAKLDKLQSMGYNVKQYTRIHEELREDYEQDRERWKIETRKYYEN